MSVLIGMMLFIGLACAIRLSPSKWKVRDTCPNCGRTYIAYARKKNICPCFRKNPMEAVCGIYFVENET